MGRKVVVSRAVRWAMAAILCVILLGVSARWLQAPGREVQPPRVPRDAVLVLFAGAADADRRMEALRVLCMNSRDPRTLLVGDDDEVEDETGRAWGPLLTSQLRERFGDCFLPVLVAGRVRTTQEELRALDTYVGRHDELRGQTLVFVTSPYHRRRVLVGLQETTFVKRADPVFLSMAPALSDFSPMTVLGELARIGRNRLGLGDVLGRRTLDNLREKTPFPRPHGTRDGG